MNQKMQEVINGTEVTETGMICLEGEAIERYRLHLLISSYSMEIVHNARTLRYPLSRVAEQYGVTVRSKKGAMKALMAIYEKTYGEPVPMNSLMERALAK
jgi:hypothetical protein